MLEYEAAGSILTVRASGVLTDAEREHVFDAVRLDPLVLVHSMFLIDLMGLKPFLQAEEMA